MKCHLVVTSICTDLGALGHPKPHFWIPLLRDPVKFELEELNELWRSLLSNVDIEGLGNTIEERIALVNNPDESIWLELFKTHVAPSIIRYQIGY